MSSFKIKYNNIEFNFINHFHKKFMNESIASSLEFFDMFLCSFMFSNDYALYYKKGLEDIINREITFKYIQSANNSVERLIKYSKRGFSMSNTSVLNYNNLKMEYFKSLEKRNIANVDPYCMYYGCKLKEYDKENIIKCTY